jgi:hypothetical protein
MPPQLSPAQNPKSGRRGNEVISIFKRQRFRLLDRDHSRIGFAGNDRHGAFMMVNRPRRADRTCALCPCPERPCCRRAAEQRDELAPFQLAARNLLLDRANAAIAASRGLGGGGFGGLDGSMGQPIAVMAAPAAALADTVERRDSVLSAGGGLTHSVETRRWPARPDLNRQKRSGRIPGSGQWQHGGRVI